MHGELARGFGDWGGADGLEEGEKVGEVLEELRQVEIRTEVRGGSRYGMLSRGGREMGVEPFLELRQVLVKVHYFGSERMYASKVLRTTNARIVIGPADFCQRHLRGMKESTSSLYHPGW